MPFHQLGIIFLAGEHPRELKKKKKSPIYKRENTEAFTKNTHFLKDPLIYLLAFSSFHGGKEYMSLKSLTSYFLLVLMDSNFLP